MRVPTRTWPPGWTRSSGRAPGACWPPLETEVAGYIEALAGELDEDGHRLVVRNGHAEPRTITTAAGGIEIHAPRVDDRRVDDETDQRCRFRSAIVPPWCRKSPKVAEVLPLMYLHGMSSGDFAPAPPGVLRLRRRPVGVGHHPADQAMAGRAAGLRRAPARRP